MTPIYQTRSGETGNCYPACLASIFHERIEDWDDCSSHFDDWEERLDAKLAARGFAQVEIIFSDDLEMRGLAVGGHYILCTNREEEDGGYCHVVIGQFMEQGNGYMSFIVVHDPYEPFMANWPPIEERDYQIDSIILLHLA